MQQLLKTHIKRNYSFKNYLKNVLKKFTILNFQAS